MINTEKLNSEFEELAEQFPEVKLPPNCFSFMKGEYVDYESRTMLKIAFPVLSEYLNPAKSMQGGFITAAFDNVIGPLSYLSAKTTCVSLDIHTNYIRPVMEGDTLTITARVVYRGASTLHISAEAVNSKNKLAATCTSHLMIVKKG
ncbi:MAG: PaaI family thioesterase [Bacteroidetes bacterium]|nr:PaaI family thioesterase [Bacteroidota bacterium]